MKRKSNNSSFFNIGSSSLLVVFLVLVLVTFAALSLATANNDLSYSKQLADRRTSYYEATSEANQIIADLDKALMSGTYSDDYEIKSEKASDISVEKDTISFKIDFTDSQALDVELKLTSEDGSDEYIYYEITKWQTVSTKEWNADDHVNLIN